MQRREHPGGVLVVEDRYDRDHVPAAGDDLRQRLRQRRHPLGVVGAVHQRERLLADDLQPSRHPDLGRRGGHRALVELAQVGLRRRLGQREVAPLKRARGADRRRPGRCRPARASRRAARRPLAPPPARPDAADRRARASRPACTTSSFSRGDVGDRRPQPPGVLEPDAGQHLHAGGDHVGGVVAAAQPGLDHRDLDPTIGQLPVGGSGQRLELGHPVVGPQRAIDELGGVGGALHGRGERGRLEVLRRRSGCARRTRPGAGTGTRRCAARGA